jgi:hypothetical protein
VTLEEVKVLLRDLGFPAGSTTDQTALTILALADRNPRSGLLGGHTSLADGARIHDILEFVRIDYERKVAENTRESYRKSSLRPLIEAGWVIRHQLTTNDPNTYYRLHSEFLRLLQSSLGSERDRLVEKLRLTGSRNSKVRSQRGGEVAVRLSAGREFILSPGPHNELEKEVVETLAPALLDQPAVVYLGDTAPRAGFQDRSLMRRLNLPIDLTASLPDVVLYDSSEKRLLVVEVVTSSGPITSARLEQLRGLVRGPSRLEVRLEYVTAFWSRRDLRRFIEEIAWGTAVWIADEPGNLIHFSALGE